MQIQVRRLGAEERSSHLFSETDERGRFVIEGLMSGEYELLVGSSFKLVEGAQIPHLQPVKQRVTVTNGTESAVTMILRVIEKPKPQ
jgi:hypothetical protein